MFEPQEKQIYPPDARLVYSNKNSRRRKRNEGKEVRTIKEGTLIATIDIGMACNKGYCATTDGRDIKSFKFKRLRYVLGYDSHKQKQICLW